MPGKRGGAAPAPFLDRFWTKVDATFLLGMAPPPSTDGILDGGRVVRHVHRDPEYGFLRGTALALGFAFLGWAVAGLVLLAGVGFWLVFDRIEAVWR